MDAQLLLAVEDCPWLDRFCRQDYRDAFREYTERFGPLYMAAAAEAGEEGLPRLAEELLDALEASWQRQRFWNRSAARANGKQMVVFYLTPMLMGLEGSGCRRLAELLAEAWIARWPEDRYHLATYEEIQSGFRRTFMGIELRK